MKKLIVVLTLLILAGAVLAQAEQPNYKIAINKFKRYYNNSQPDSLFSMFSPDVKAGLPLEKTKELITQMHAQIGDLKETTFTKYVSSAGVYKADYNKETLLINLSLNGLNQVDGLYFNEYKPEKAANKKPSALPDLQVAKAASAQTPIGDPSLIESPVSLSTLAGTLSGTLTIPKDAPAKLSVVLIVGGSGPIDRDGNGPGLQSDSYKLLAAALGKAGIASLRYDKRGVGQSKTSAKEVDSRFTDLSDDASAWMGMLKDDKRFVKVVVLGHSEGSLIGMLAIVGSETPMSGFISVAGAGEPAEAILTEQMKLQPPSIGVEFKRIVDSLRRGKTTEKVDPMLYSLMRPSIQKYMMSWMQFDPQRVIKRIKVPILILQGSTDMQISVAQAEKLKKAKSEATLKIIDGMSHILKDGPTDREQNFATYNNPVLPLKPEFVTAVVLFVNTVK